MRRIYTTSFFLGEQDAPGPQLDEVARVCVASIADHPAVDPDAALALDLEQRHRRAAIGSRAHLSVLGGESESDGRRSWGCRLEHTDEHDDTLLWRTDTCVHRDPDGQTAFACTSWVSGSSSASRPLLLHARRPQPVYDVIRNWDAYRGGIRLPVVPMLVDEDRAPRLADAIMSPRRQRPLVFVSARFSDDRHVVDPTRLADILAGTAHVLKAADQWPSRVLEKILPDDMTCYNGAIRLYWPQPRGRRDLRHMLWLPSAIEEIGRVGRDAFAHHLLGYLMENVVHIDDPDAPSWARLEQFDREQGNRASADDRELARLYAEECDELRAENDHLRGQLEDRVAELDGARDEAQAWRSHGERLTASLASGDTEPVALEPSTVAEAVALARTAFAGRLSFSLNNRSDVRRSPFEDVGALWRAFEFLATTYRDARLGRQTDIGRQNRGDLASVAQATLGWDYSSHQSESTMKRFRNWYHTRWRGRVMPLPSHLGTGISRDPRHTIRVAFNWDDETRTVVVGYIGQHQRTEAS